MFPLIFLLDKIQKESFNSQRLIVELMSYKKLSTGAEAEVSDVGAAGSIRSLFISFKTKLFFFWPTIIFFLKKERNKPILGIEFCINPCHIAIHDLRL